MPHSKGIAPPSMAKRIVDLLESDPTSTNNSARPCAGPPLQLRKSSLMSLLVEQVAAGGRPGPQIVMFGNIAQPARKACALCDHLRFAFEHQAAQFQQRLHLPREGAQGDLLDRGQPLRARFGIDHATTRQSACRRLQESAFRHRNRMCGRPGHQRIIGKPQVLQRVADNEWRLVLGLQWTQNETESGVSPRGSSPAPCLEPLARGFSGRLS